MNLKVVHVLEEAPDNWNGETGLITAEILDKHLSVDRADWHYFICGPIPMIVAMEKALLQLDIPLTKIHTENYEMA
jgi:predicted ferric reductase